MELCHKQPRRPPDRSYYLSQKELERLETLDVLSASGGEDGLDYARIIGEADWQYIRRIPTGSGYRLDVWDTV